MSLRTCGFALLWLLAGPAMFAASGQAQVRSGPVVIHHWPGGERLADALARAIEGATYPALPADVLGDQPVTVYLAPDEARFDSLTGGRVPDWGAGVAVPEAGLIVLPGWGADRGPLHELARVLKHELAHVALQRYLGAVRVPRWFSEGYATWAAGQLDPSAGWLLRLAFLSGRAPPLDSLILDWPAGTIDARVAYLLSATAVQWLYDRGGDRVMRIFLQRWRDGADFEGALRATYGLHLGQLERHWSASVRRRYGWGVFLAQSVVIWAITAVIVLGLYMIRRRRDRSRLALLRATEPPDVPAFWNEIEPDPREAAPDPGPGPAPAAEADGPAP